VLQIPNPKGSRVPEAITLNQPMLLSAERCSLLLSVLEDDAARASSPRARYYVRQQNQTHRRHCSWVVQPIHWSHGILECTQRSALFYIHSYNQLGNRYHGHTSTILSCLLNMSSFGAWFKPTRSRSHNFRNPLDLPLPRQRRTTRTSLNVETPHNGSLGPSRSSSCPCGSCVLALDSWRSNLSAVSQSSCQVPR